MTFTATIGPVTWVGGVVTNQGKTFLTFTLTPSFSISTLAEGTLAGTLTMIGTPLGGGAAVTFSGAVTGNYVQM